MLAHELWIQHDPREVVVVHQWNVVQTLGIRPKHLLHNVATQSYKLSIFVQKSNAAQYITYTTTNNTAYIIGIEDICSLYVFCYTYVYLLLN